MKVRKIYYIIAGFAALALVGACGGGGNEKGDTQIQNGDVNYSKATADLNEANAKAALDNGATLYKTESQLNTTFKLSTKPDGTTETYLDRMVEASTKFMKKNPILRDNRLSRGILPALRRTVGIKPKSGNKIKFLPKIPLDNTICTGGGSMSVEGIPSDYENKIESDTDLTEEDLTHWLESGLDVSLKANNCKTSEATYDGTVRMKVKYKETDTSFTNTIEVICSNFSYEETTGDKFKCDGSMKMDQNGSVDGSTVTYVLLMAYDNYRIEDETGWIKIDGTGRAKMTSDGAGDPENICDDYLDYVGTCDDYMPEDLPFSEIDPTDFTLEVIIDATVWDNGEKNVLLTSFMMDIDSATLAGAITYAVYPTGNADDGYLLLTISVSGDKVTFTLTGKDGTTKTYTGTIQSDGTIDWDDFDDI